MIVNSKNNNSKKVAILVAVIVAVLYLIPLLLIWLIVSILIAFNNGADLGGLGAAPSDPEPWVTPVVNILLLYVLVSGIIIGTKVYKWKMKKSSKV